MDSSGNIRTVSDMTYIPRIVDDELTRRLESARIVVIEGAKACGKTETALQAARSVVRLDVDGAARLAAATDPALVLEGETPRLIDEWQTEPAVWNHARQLSDDRKRPGQFILTGSAVPDDDPNRHSGAGRFSFIRMRPMCLFESTGGAGTISLAALMNGETLRAGDMKLSVPELADLLVRGGWPAQQIGSVASAAQAAKDYLTQIRQVDVNRVSGPRRDPAKVALLLSSLARNVSTEVTLKTLATDSSGPGEIMSPNTVNGYLEALSRVMVIEDLPAWSPHLRSKTPLRQAMKRQFVDPSLAAAALGAGPARLSKDLEFLGLMFESLVIRDLRVLSQPLDGLVSHYRDKSGLEVDAIIQLSDGRWGAFEVKLGGEKLIDEGATALLRLADVVDTKKSGAPSVLAVICMSGYSYRRKDGVAIVSIGSLAP
jgi:predicted AAA+ superfamily ATPase